MDRWTLVGRFIFGWGRDAGLKRSVAGGGVNGHGSRPRYVVAEDADPWGLSLYLGWGKGK